LVATGAFAQSSVTIGGQLDAGYTNTKVTIAGAAGAVAETTVSQNGMGSGNFGASRVWFKGTEDMGAGNKANFELQMQPSLADGTTNAATFNRGAWLGLSGGWGELRMGRQGTSTAGVVCGIIDQHGCYGSFAGGGVLFSGNVLNPNVGTKGVGGQMFLANAQNYAAVNGQSPSANGGNEATRYTRAFVYMTPVFAGGFTGQVDYAFNGVAPAPIAAGANNAAVGGMGKTTAATVRYATGPLDVAFNMQRADSATTGNATAGTNTLGAKYDLGAAVVRFGYQKSSSSSAGTDGNGKALSLSVKFPMGAFAPYFAMNRNSTTISTAGATSDLYSSKILNVGTTYALSKRTDAYADFAKDGGSNGSGAGAFNVNASAISIGLRHNF
jgi:predicted porin